MKVNQLILRCYAERKNGLWQAFCIDLCLAVQGESIEEVQQKLQEQIYHYVGEALTEDKLHAEVLLNRKAPLIYRAKFYVYKLLSNAHRCSKSIRAFLELMPMQPSAPARPA